MLLVPVSSPRSGLSCFHAYRYYAANSALRQRLLRPLSTASSDKELLPTMTTMYDEKKQFDGGTLKPYPHEERGSERGRAKDPVKFLLAVEQRARERQVAIETVKILRKDVIECYRKEGVNHYENCKKPVAAYYDVIIKKDLGQVQPKWENAEKMDGWM